MKLQFLGAAQTVTGSAHLFTIGDRRILFDCGLFQGRRQEAREMNEAFSVNPTGIDHVVLSHAHIDHSGRLPLLVRSGFDNPIWCTSATADLVRVLLRDAGHIQEKDAETMNRRRARSGDEPVEPLYTLEDAEETLPLLRSAYYGQPFTLFSGTVDIAFRDAGHILGSAFVEMTVREDGVEKRLVYSGDLGRRGRPILRSPEAPGPADTLILESTYGGRVHRPLDKADDRLCEAIDRVIKRRGKIVIPAFSVDRTQEIVFALNNLWNAGRLPRVPVYVDSPMSANVTEVYRNHPECYGPDIKQVFLTDSDPFGFEGLIYVRDTQASKRINALENPCIIISASGMCEAGRVLHHLSNTVGDPRNAVFVVGFMAENTLGRKLVDGLPEVRILGEMHPVRAEVVTFNDFSGHADSEELREFARKVAAHGRLKDIYLVHGEVSNMQALRDALAGDLPDVRLHMPLMGETATL